LTASTLLAAAGLFLSASALVRLLYGTGMSSAGTPLRILSLALVPAVLNNAWLLELYARSREGVVVNVLWRGLLVNVTLNLFLISWRGAEGAALSLVVSEWLVLAGFGRELREPAPGVSVPLFEAQRS
jgi:O-antigen/teichoic acid export membrane protein